MPRSSNPNHSLRRPQLKQSISSGNAFIIPAPAPLSGTDNKSASTTNLLKLGRSELSHGTNSDIKNLPVLQDNYYHDAADSNDNESILVDVLPSFEMYNVLHRHIPQGNVDPDRHEFPPNYQEETTNTTTTPTVETPTATSSATSLDLEHLQTVHYMMEDDLNDQDNIIIERLYSLPKLNVSPINIEIKITKNASQPHVKSEETSILKEYTNGDIIHGYCTIENTTNQHLKFEMFYVTLEGYISIVDRVQGKRTIKRFLRMVDLSASWSYTDIDLSSGIDIRTGEIDKYDNCVIGLKNSRMLEPFTKYKKFFMFKLPNQLLDVVCKHEISTHVLLPPSLNIDKFKNFGKYASIHMNDVLGCGHNGMKGSPVLTNDLSDDNVSINYTIDAKIVGKNLNSSKLFIMKEKEYNLRVMPFQVDSRLFGERTSMRQLNDLQTLIDERIAALKNIFRKLENNKPIISSDIHGLYLSGNFDDATINELNSQEILQRKLDQLHINNRLNNNNELLSDFKNILPKENTIEAQLNYKFKKHSSSGFLSGILSSASSSLSLSSVNDIAHPTASQTPTSPNISHSSANSTNNSGLIIVRANIPTKSLPYCSPSLLRKTNKFENKNKHDQDNWVRLNTTNNIELLDEIELKLLCLQSNNSLPHEPPSIHSISLQLVAINIKSDYSIPIKLHSELLQDKERLKNLQKTFKNYHRETNDFKSRFESESTKLNELYNIGRQSHNLRHLNFEDFISEQIESDILSLIDLKVHTTEVNDFFKKHKQMGENTSSWTKVNDLQFEKNLKIKLEINKDMNETIIPNFESCLFGRFYCIEVTIKFDRHIGSTKLSIPINIKNLI
ncbi:hypothetical protein KAFR_0A02790 [Kazachstania africana CBS 2517]|uniref:Bul1 N-terminal domain-containing protein n=1 Tax=Kazachstania africana (strain ATCC 22294 / BCRC 22015 / CBS 2517 / CECT 1963 / NBRC 1671 / NRRL Y-8276) TaxID=1071382 RepID=H2AMW5_KAZAF|nr:hypothetical protein KAFR_0A02790 [Kazachstania africana CBS 2517]CCF55715.1 hypothetical protein KAFR_0A02790 [Kazachstania africana CBS 2517]